MQWLGGKLNGIILFYLEFKYWYIDIYFLQFRLVERTDGHKGSEFKAKDKIPFFWALYKPGLYTKTNWIALLLFKMLGSLDFHFFVESLDKQVWYFYIV